MANKVKVPREAEAILTDLDVKEVSLVDRPANKRRFLVVKRDDGRLAVVRKMEDNNMKTNTANNADAATSDFDLENIAKDDLAELFGDLLDGDDQDDNPPPDEDLDPPPDLEIIEKVMNKELATNVIKAAIQHLLPVVNKLKSSADKSQKLDVSQVAIVKKVSQALLGLAGKMKGKPEEESDKKGGKEDKTEKVAKDALAAITAVIEKLMGVVNTLKALGESDDIPAGVVSEIQATATALNSIASSYENPPTSGKEKKVEKMEIFSNKKSSDGDTEVVIKSAKGNLKRVKLTKLKNAISTLQDIIKELEDGTPTPKPADVAKNDDAVMKAISELSTKIETKIDEVAKRVEAVEKAAPAGSESTTPIEKRNGLWSSVFKQ